MRIAYVITDLELGGVPLHLLRVAQAVRDRGHAVQVISLSSPGPVSAMLRDAGVDTDSCGARRALNLFALWRLRQKLKSSRPDVVHALLFHANIACRLIGPLAGIKPRQLICEIQTVEIERRWHLTVDRWTHGLCRLEIGNSPAVVNHLREVARLPDSKLRLVGGGVDIPAIESASPLPRSEIGADNDRPLLMWVGRFDPAKGLDELIAALDLLRRRQPVHLALVGDGAYRSHCERLIDRLELGDHVSFLGARRDVARLLKTCDVFVFPSQTEGLPNALLEAMAAGCPIVCSDIPPHREVVADRTSALLVRRGDPAVLANAVFEVLTDSELRQRLGQKAQQTVRESYNINSMCDKYLKLYRD